MAKKQPKQLFFRCPSCDRENVCEVTGGFTLARISELSDDGDIVTDKMVGKKTKIQRFECWGCGLVLRNLAGKLITTRKQLSKWVNKNCPQKELKAEFDARMANINKVYRQTRIKNT